MLKKDGTLLACCNQLKPASIETGGTILCVLGCDMLKSLELTLHGNLLCAIHLGAGVHAALERLVFIKRKPADFTTVSTKIATMQLW